MEKSCNVIFFLTCLVVSVALQGCSTMQPTGYPINRDGIFTFYSSQYRANRPVAFFGEEYRLVRERQQQAVSAEKPSKLVGLALSGGGIRSNAFQLGILRGLNGKSLLAKVGYISAVSGGSWAAGAYKSSTMDDNAFFQALDDYVGTEKSKLCDASQFTLEDAILGKTVGLCQKPAARILLNSYRGTLGELKKTKLINDLLKAEIGYSSREAWRSMIQKNILNGNDVRLIELEKNPLSKNRPFLIVNATHDEYKATKMKRNFPFELTMLGMGTVADCGNADYCSSFSPATGPVFLNYRESGDDTLYLSHALAFSSAVLPSQLFGIKLDLLEWSVQFPASAERKTGEEPPYRPAFLLADGGHSENLGAFALIERGVDLVIISDAAHDPKNTFGDFEALRHHVEKLLKREVYLANGKESPAVSPEQMKSGAHVNLFHGCYGEKLANGGKCPEGAGQIVYLKPPDRMDGYYSYLKNSGYDFIYNYLVLNKTDFPESKTYAVSYDSELIFAYYLLGKYLAEEQLAPEMTKFINTAQKGGRAEN